MTEGRDTQEPPKLRSIKINPESEVMPSREPLDPKVKQSSERDISSLTTARETADRDEDRDELASKLKRIGNATLSRRNLLKATVGLAGIALDKETHVFQRG